MTTQQKELARHALGLPNRRSISYRNRFVAERGHEHFAQWQAMVALNYAGCYIGHEPNTYFWLTSSGASLALNSGECLDEEDFPIPGTP